LSHLAREQREGKAQPQYRERHRGQVDAERHIERKASARAPAFTLPCAAALNRAIGMSRSTANVHAASAHIGRKIAAWSISFLVNLMQAVEINTGPDPAAAVIWLHGLGADGHDFEPIVPELGLTKPVRFVFPHAPVRPVTINQGMRMRAWYDIFQFGGGPEDEAGVRASQKLLDGMIAEEKRRGIAKIVLAGFSQGGAIALQTALRCPERLAGLLALSTYLPLNASVEAERSPASRELPIFMAHGEYDEIIPLARAEQSRQILERLGYQVEWHTYPMPHSVCPEEIADISAFLRRVLV
jgi:phospholipase/carboxylesterase